ncbi:MAG TPA: CheR family methyltransferase [Acetobacteraceae bacterium]|nr:CheR family methyltransferase [Acetobacteraceae bacterium]
MIPALPAEAFKAIADLLRNRSGLVITPDQAYLLETRLAPIVRRQGLPEGLPGFSALADRLGIGKSTVLVDEVVEAMTTNETLFFRDVTPFEVLATRVLPRLVRTRPIDAPIRIWSAAAASGQEAYSVAMIIAESGPAIRPERFEIIGTDIAREPLARARRGLYSQFEVERGLTDAMRARHFRQEADGWRINPALRRAVTFREWNLLSDPRPLGRFDVILCRNVLIYFDHPTKARVLRAVAGQMVPDAVLYLGGAETVLGLTDRLSPAADLPCAFALCNAAEMVTGSANVGR